MFPCMFSMLQVARFLPFRVFLFVCMFVFSSLEGIKTNCNVAGWYQNLSQVDYVDYLFQKENNLS